MYWLLILLVSNCRSLFVPYFKYLLDSCIRHLTVAEDENIAFPRKKKKAKIQDANSNKDDGHRTMTPHMWHLRAMVLSSLHKCFLYDTGSLKFLDSSNFQVSGAPFFIFNDLYLCCKIYKTYHLCSRIYGPALAV